MILENHVSEADETQLAPRSSLTAEPALPEGAVFIVTYDTVINGRRMTGYYGFDFNQCTWREVVSLIGSNELQDVRRVLLASPDDNHLEDVTEEMAADVLEYAADMNGRDAIPDYVINFAERALGCRHVAEYRREMEEA